jgi:hypothetical protein
MRDIDVCQQLAIERTVAASLKRIGLVCCCPLLREGEREKLGMKTSEQLTQQAARNIPDDRCGTGIGKMRFSSHHTETHIPVHILNGKQSDFYQENFELNKRAKTQ